MVLASMKIKEWKEQAWKEGYEQGLQEGRRKVREEWRKRWDEAYARFGIEVDGVLMLPLTPEVERFLGWRD